MLDRSHDPLRMLRKLAQMNRLANGRLHHALMDLPDGEYVQPRPAFFGSIKATLNHILLVDRFYINALEGHSLNTTALDQARDCPDLATLTAWQEAEDLRLLRHVEGLTVPEMNEVISIDRGIRVQTDRRDDVLSHLFQHQTHHRGQVHGLLSATIVAPPQLDEFIVGDDAPARAADMARLGWSEDDLMR
jgi:uncharacterized damage-inducible protein DinB